MNIWIVFIKDWILIKTFAAKTKVKILKYEELEKAIEQAKKNVKIIPPFTHFVEAIDKVARKLEMNDEQVSEVLDFLSESVYRPKRKASPSPDE